ncbi:MAG TPA: hypothetical protein VNZ58_07435 [Thermomicrobiales bacterium]|nr:hypothetical protein [Thermomicrobiales bacterium]
MTDEFPIEEPTPQPLHLATREDIARTPSLFSDTVMGALNVHALWRLRNLAVPDQQSEADMALALALLADTDRYIRVVMRVILHSSEQSGLEDVTALTDADVTQMVETLWPQFVQVAMVP